MSDQEIYETLRNEKEKVRTAKSENDRRRHKERVKSGLCTRSNCSLPRVPGLLFCEEHRARNIRDHAKHNAAKREKKGPEWTDIKKMYIMKRMF